MKLTAFLFYFRRLNKLFIFLILLSIGFSNNLYSQNVAVTDDEGYMPATSAMLDVYSLNKGMLVPRLDSTQRVNISSPALGLLVFDLTKNSFMYYNGSGWITIPQMSTTSVVGKALFAVTNADGDTVFAVYNDGVKVTVDEGSKGRVGGFAVSGRTPTKLGGEIEYFRVTPDSTRVYINDSSYNKGSVGGFAVSGRTPTKVGEFDYLRVTPDSTRVYVNEGFTKTSVGGFAVSGRTPTKTSFHNYFLSSTDSTRIYINNTTTSKGSVGGFAVSGRTPTKGTTGDYFNISGNTTPDTIYPSEPRIVWYPNKEAFMAGRVEVRYPDSVGLNSSALGFESRAYGDYSQAFGFDVIARGDYSTAIGKNAIADSTNSFAFGEGAKALNDDSYSFGAGAKATGIGSYAVGSVSRDTLGNQTGVYTEASGNYSVAIGQGSRSTSTGSFAIGVDNSATGDFSVALGYKATTNGYGSIALGYRTNAIGQAATSMGWLSQANGMAATAMGYDSYASGFAATAFGMSTATGMYSVSLNSALAIGTNSVAMCEGWTTATGYCSVSMGSQTKSSGYHSTSMGYGTLANTYSMLVVGRYNDTTRIATDSYKKWYSLDPLFVVGNGPDRDVLRNAFTILKNGYTGIGTAAPSQKLELGGTSSNIYLNSLTSNMILFNTSGVGAPAYTTRSAGTKLVLYPGITSTKADYAIGIEDYTLWLSVPSNTDRFKFYAGTTELMRIQGDGKVGIGTTAPTHKIDVRGPVRIVNDPDFYDVWIQGGSATGGDDRNLAICGKDENSGDQLVINYDAEYAYGTVIPGYVGIGSTGNNSSYKLLVYGNAGGTSWTNTSDIRWKKNIKPLEGVLNSILALKGVKYEWRADEFPKMNFDNRINIGLIAQDLEKYFPELVFTDNEGYKSVAYDKLSAVLIEGMKEQQKQIESLKAELESIKTLLNSKK